MLTNSAPDNVLACVIRIESHCLPGIRHPSGSKQSLRSRRRAALAHKATGFSAKLLRRTDQCRALLVSANLHWQAVDPEPAATPASPPEVCFFAFLIFRSDGDGMRCSSVVMQRTNGGAIGDHAAGSRATLVIEQWAAAAQRWLRSGVRHCGALAPRTAILPLSIAHKPLKWQYCGVLRSMARDCALRFRTGSGAFAC